MLKNESLYVALIDESVKFVSVRYNARITMDKTAKRRSLTGYIDPDDMDEDEDYDKYDGGPYAKAKAGYIYKTRLKLSAGDFVIVHAAGKMQIAEIVEYDVPMPTSETVNYKWIIGNITSMIDDAYDTVMQERAIITKINEARMRSSRSTLLAALGLDEQAAQGLLAATSNDADVIDDNDKDG